MEKKKTFLGILICVLLGIVLFVIIKQFGVGSTSNSTSNQTTNGNESTSSDEVTVIDTSTDLSITNEESQTYTNFDAKINLLELSCEGNGVAISGKTITIGKAGTYYFWGIAENTNLIVEATNKDDVVLVFENVSIKSSNTAAIFVKQANVVTINIPSGTTSTFVDDTTYTELDEDEEPDGAIFSKDNLKITGSGTLKVTANYKDGIVSKDTLTIIDTNVVVTSKDDGIRGKDYVQLKNSNITVNSEGDGIKSTNDTDESLGYVLIKGGKININSGADGIQAEQIINISDSDITITTTGDVDNSHQENFGRQTASTQNTSSSDSASSKGLKAGKEITINSGKISITSTDDSIHSNYYVIINDGEISLSSGDDGIHADTNVKINDGTINIAKSYEGIEANYIEINGGDISVVASDDGINVSGGNDQSAIGGRDNFSNVDTGNRKLVINGGKVYVNSDGDGLDANGSIELNGGEVIVPGTASNGNGALDYDNSFTVNGGSIIYYGATGMWQNPSTSSKQYSICFGVSGKAGDEIVLKDSNGNIVANIKTEKTYGAVTISNSSLKQGETYTLYINGTASGSQTISSIVTSNLTTGGMNGGQMNGGNNVNRGAQNRQSM